MTSCIVNLLFWACKENLHLDAHRCAPLYSWYERIDKTITPNHACGKVYIRTGGGGGGLVY